MQETPEWKPGSSGTLRDSLTAVCWQTAGRVKIKLSAALGENLPDTFLDVGSTPTVSTIFWGSEAKLWTFYIATNSADFNGQRIFLCLFSDAYKPSQTHLKPYDLGKNLGFFSTPLLWGESRLPHCCVRNFFCSIFSELISHNCRSVGSTLCWRKMKKRR